jgi:acetyl-CoA acyltransferase
MQKVYIVSAVRSPIGKARGVFSTTRPDDLLSQVLRECMHRAPAIPLDAIQDVIIGCAMPEAEQGMNVARLSVLLAGFPDTVPAMTINRFCSSGLQAIDLAASRIGNGEADVIVAGGVESMTYVPMGGYHFAANPRYFTEPEHESIAFSMGITAEIVAKKWGISREAQDQFALRSHQNALRAVQEGAFKEEMMTIQTTRSVPDLQSGRITDFINEVNSDQGPRKDTNLESLAKLRPVFHQNGTVTAGNTSQMSDGAAALVLVSEKYLQEHDLTPLAIFRGYAVRGVDPKYMGIGPIKAIPEALRMAGLSQDRLDWIELNEAFAAQSLAVIKEMNFDLNKVNPCGGAIALGHPLGATGAILATKVIYGLKRQQQKYGMVTMCIGTGMGAAGIFEIC